MHRDAQSIDESLFLPARRGELIEAILVEFEGITATAAAVDTDAVEEAEEDDAGDDHGDDEAP